MSNPTPSAPARTESAAERFRRIVDGIAARLDPDYPSTFVPDGAATIDDGSEFYGADDGRPAMVAADDAGWSKAP